MDAALKKSVLDFLQKRPRGTAAIPFILWCLAEIQFHLMRLRGARHRLPLDLTNPERSIEDLAIDVAGFYLGEESEERYHKIFHYLEIHGYSEFREEDLSDIIRLLRAQIVRFTDQRIFKFSRQEYPESGKCKKAVEAALGVLESRLEIHSVLVDGGRNTLISDSSSGMVNPQLPFAPFLDLVSIIDNIYAHTLNKVQLCRLSLMAVAQQEQFQKRVHRHEFIEAVVAVISRRALLEAPQLSYDDGPIRIILRQEMENDLRTTLTETTEKDLKEQAAASRIRNDEVTPLVRAVESYLLDSINGGPDKITKYFYAEMPPDAHAQFRSKYKYAFETVVTRSRDDFCRRIKRNSTIRKLWDYL